MLLNWQWICIFILVWSDEKNYFFSKTGRTKIVVSDMFSNNNDYISNNTWVKDVKRIKYQNLYSL